MHERIILVFRVETSQIYEYSLSLKGVQANEERTIFSWTPRKGFNPKISKKGFITDKKKIES